MTSSDPDLVAGDLARTLDELAFAHHSKQTPTNEQTTNGEPMSTGTTNSDETPEVDASDDERVAHIPDDETTVADNDVAADGDELEGTTGGLT